LHSPFFSIFTGTDSPYEAAQSPTLAVNTVECSADEADAFREPMVGRETRL
jgi:adenylylsulfate kinase-like enzyme